MILYIEDNEQIGKNVKTYLEAEWFFVQRYMNGLEWLETALSGRFDCIVLDVMLPWIDGFEICREVRKKKNTPIIMTTARGELDDKWEWFSWWADDYLVKPFEMQELVMRIQSLIKRSQVSDVFMCGDLEVFLDENRCVKWWVEVHLTLKEWQIFMELIDAQWITVTRADIVESVWGEESLYETDGKLDVYIANLRKKIGKESIETIKWVWYRLHT